MSMSTHVYAIRAADKSHQLKVAAWKANEAAGVRQPTELVEYFGEQLPDDGGLVVDVPRDALTDYCNEKWSQSGFDVDLSKLPAGTRNLRVVNCW